MSAVEQLEAAGEVLSPAVRAVILALEAELEQLRAQVRELEARLAQDSSTSSRPPSSDPPGKVRRKKKPTGRKRGGQKGHPGHHRMLLPPERIDATLRHYPEQCRHCGHTLLFAPEAKPVQRHQVVELPAVRAHVTEHQLFCLACPTCGEATRAELPPELAGKHFGPLLTAQAALLLGRLRLSRRDLVWLYSELLDVPGPSLGSTAAFAQQASRALLPAQREVRREVRGSESVGVDETGWKLRGRVHWLWSAVSRRATLFHLGPSRGAKELLRLVGRDYPGVVTSDRWSAYRICLSRQLCWAHLKRNAEGLGLRGGSAEAFARWAVAECDRLFALWHRWRRADAPRTELARALVPLKARFARLLRRGSASEDRKVAAFCRNLQGLWSALWTFGSCEVEPTNNAAERALRRGVLWRKGCFGSQSGAGLRFVERILTLTETARQNDVRALDYLRRAITASRSGAPAPLLLPAP
jgi:transposase